MKEVYNIAIIGGGPGGIASAVEAAILGIEDVILFEKGDNHSTTIRKYYKDQKRVDKDFKGQKIELNGNIFFCDGTKESTIDLFDTLVKEHQFDAEFKTEVGSIRKEGDYFVISTNQMKEVKARYVVISIGKMGQPNRPAYPIPAGIKTLVNFNANGVQPGENVLVVGGGNAAVEYACLLSQNNPVTLNYRQKEFKRINQANANSLAAALEKGSIVGKIGLDIQSLEDDGGKPKVNFTDGTTETFDRVIYAIGGIAPVDFLKNCGLELDENGVPKIDEKNHSSVDGIYVAGDILYKNGGSIAAALNHGFSIVKEIKDRLQG